MSLGIAKGRIDGVAEVRDRHGNLKGTFKFGGEATAEEQKAVEAANPNVEVQHKSGDSHGSDTSHGGA